jgi:hypothetical protein
LNLLFILYSLQVRSSEAEQLLAYLREAGPQPSTALQEKLGKSQASVSRTLARLASQVVPLGRGRSRLYGIQKSIRRWPFQHPIYWTSAEGLTQPVGTLRFIEPGIIHVEGGGLDLPASKRLPWYLSTLKLEGFLGRLQAQRLALQGLPESPEHWSLEDVLYGALTLDAPPGAIIVGDVSQESVTPEIPEGEAGAHRLDEIAQDVAATLPAGSSAGGEQAKFLARLHDGRHVLVKFAPPLRSPLGERWKDLLHAEALAATVLTEHGVLGATTWVVETSQRAYLISERFDRVGKKGRRHVVSIGAAHDGLIGDNQVDWPGAADSLARLRRLTEPDRQLAHALYQFGRLIGNTDMHSGNLSLYVERDTVARGPLTLAPVYDMLPMIWKPNPLYGQADCSPFQIDDRLLSGPLVGAARQFWRRLSELPSVSRSLQWVATEMAGRLPD